MIPIIVSFFILTSLSAFSLYKTYWVIEQFEILENTVVATERDATNALNTFKTQVQEWKNVLLRGHNREDRDKYWQRFIAKESEVRQSLTRMLDNPSVGIESRQQIDKFLSAHNTMATSYRAGYQAFVNSSYDHKAGDAAVRGIDREPANLLNQLTTSMAMQASVSLKQLKQSVRHTLFFILCGLIAIVFLTMFYVTNRLRNQIIQPVKSIAERIEALSRSDYNHSIEYESANELGLLADSARILQLKLTHSVSTLIDVEKHVKAANDSLQTVSQDIQSGALEQGEATQHLGESTQLLEGSVGSLVRISAQVDDLSIALSNNAEVCYDTFEAANNGFSELANTVTESSQTVEALQRRSSDIFGVVNVINEIADQTNLLALNAAIEAARAGEHGRGFAVVADEVRALAAKTQQSTKEINKILSAFESESKSAVVAMHRGKALSETNAGEARSALKRLKVLVKDITQVRNAIDELNGITTQQTDVVVKVTGISHRIVTVAEQYRALAARNDITEHMQTGFQKVDHVVSSLKQFEQMR